MKPSAIPDGMPIAVQRFEKAWTVIILVQLLAGLSLADRTFPPNASEGVKLGIDIGIPIVAVFMLWLIWLVSRRRKRWALWLFVCLLVIGSVSTVIQFPATYEANPILAYYQLASVVAQAGATSFLIHPDSRLWLSPATDLLSISSAPSAATSELQKDSPVVPQSTPVPRMDWSAVAYGVLAVALLAGSAYFWFTKEDALDFEVAIDKRRSLITIQSANERDVVVKQVLINNSSNCTMSPTLPNKLKLGDTHLTAFLFCNPLKVTIVTDRGETSYRFRQ